MSTPLIGGPHDGLRWSGPIDPVIFMEDEVGRTSIYRLGHDGRYHHVPPAETGNLFEQRPPSDPGTDPDAD